ncbi:MAG: hypothetical protein RJA83_1160, partial [Pseudomonadota bacterium]
MSVCQKFNFSFEVFPPKTKKGLEDLNQTRQELCQLKPKYFSVTFGAGGSLQQKSLEVVRQFVAHGIAATPHISCVNMTSQRLQELLCEYKQLGIKQLLVIQGDLPSDGTQIEIEFNDATELIIATSESLCSRKILAVVSPKFVRITRLILSPDSSGVRHALA